MKAKRYILPILLAPFVFSSLSAQTVWTNSGGDFNINNSENWSNGLPSLSSVGTIDNGDTVEISDRQQLDDKIYEISNGSTINVGSGARGLRWEGGSITLNGGNFISQSSSLITIGRDSGGSPTTLNVNNGSTVNFAGTVDLGRDSQGIVNQTGNSNVTIVGQLNIQANATGVVSNNVYNLSGGSVTVGGLNVFDRNADNSNYFNFTTNSTGTLTIVGDSVFDFASFINEGLIRLNDNISSDIEDFLITSETIGADTLTTLQLTTTIPEPGTYALLASALAFSVVMIRRRRSN